MHFLHLKWTKFGEKKHFLPTLAICLLLCNTNQFSFKVGLNYCIPANFPPPPPISTGSNIYGQNPTFRHKWGKLDHKQRTNVAKSHNIVPNL